MALSYSPEILDYMENAKISQNKKTQILRFFNLFNIQNYKEQKDYIDKEITKQQLEDFNYYCSNHNEDVALILTELEHDEKLKKKFNLINEENYNNNLLQSSDFKIYNFKKLKYQNKDEIRLYKMPISSQGGNNSKGKKNKYTTNENGEEINIKTGELRTEKSKKHSTYNSIFRTKQKIYNLCMGNDWEDGYFFTITFNQKYVDRYDYNECYKRIKGFLDNVRKKNPNIQYIAVPEHHKDGAWHFHALIKNIDNSILISSGKFALGNQIYNAPVENSKEIFNINNRTFKYGFTTATKIENTEATSCYLLKYITKDLIENTEGKNRYIRSKNLNEPEEITYFIDFEYYEQVKDFLTSEENEELLNIINKKEYINDKTLQSINYIFLKN